MRVGLYYGWELTGGQSAADLFSQMFEQVEEADYLGYDSALIGESQFSSREISASVPDLLGGLSGSTRFIRLGSLGKALPLQHPARIAEDYAVLDLLSNGRLIVGVGPGESTETFSAFDIPFDERIPRFKETINFLRRAWTSDAFSYGGDYIRFPANTEGREQPFEAEPYRQPFLLPWQRVGIATKHLAITPRTVQTPHPPIWISANNREIVSFAAKIGCSILPYTNISDQEAVELYSLYADEMGKEGREIFEVERPLIRGVFVAPNQAQAMEVAGKAHAQLYQQYTTDGHFRSADDKNIDFSGSDLDQLMRDRIIIGDVDQVFDRIKILQEKAGINHIICRMSVPGISHIEVMKSIRLFASEVMMRLRS